ncbi:hypothetical protein [Shigella flexneri]|uniref:hypothetical protein n=1 Tax=Shigella flexneri TaxID=623 RepID=UPI0020945D8A|nr:hypothetical protein [Shigella flexneri]
MRAEIALMSGSAFAVTHHAFSSGAGRTSDGNGSHASTLKSPSYTKSVSWQHYQYKWTGIQWRKEKQCQNFCLFRDQQWAWRNSLQLKRFSNPVGSQPVRRIRRLSKPFAS